MADDPKLPPPTPPKVAKRTKQVGVRIDEELHDEAMEKARPYGGLSAVIRAMLRAFVKGERNFDVEDLVEENTPASKPKPPKHKKR